MRVGLAFVPLQSVHEEEGGSLGICPSVSPLLLCTSHLASRDPALIKSDGDALPCTWGIDLSSSVLVIALLRLNAELCEAESDIEPVMSMLHCARSLVIVRCAGEESVQFDRETSETRSHVHRESITH